MPPADLLDEKARQRARAENEDPLGGATAAAHARIRWGHAGAPPPPPALEAAHAGVGAGRRPPAGGSEEAHEAPRLAHLDVRGFVERIPEKEIAGEHRHADDVTQAAAPRPAL